MHLFGSMGYAPQPQCPCQRFHGLGDVAWLQLQTANTALARRGLEQDIAPKPPDPAYQARCAEWVARFKRPQDAASSDRPQDAA